MMGVMAPDDHDWRRLADYVARRRNELGLTQAEVQAVGGPSAATVRLIEAARQDGYRDVILGRLEAALRWAPGSVGAILSGHEPTPSDRRGSPHPLAVEESPDEAEVRRILDSGLSPELKRRLVAHVRDRQRRDRERRDEEIRLIAETAGERWDT